MTIYSIAKYFLNKDKSISHRKLQELCYYSYVWWYTFYQNSLFTAKFEAWVHGPTNRQLYSDWQCNDKLLILNSEDITFLDLKMFLEDIWKEYGQYTGLELASISHQELPWLKARAGLRAYEPCTDEIDDTFILQEYSNRLNS